MTTITKIEAKKQKTDCKLRVAAYCRVSTSTDEQLESLDAQRKHYDQLIRRNREWTYVGIYYDEGITGTKKDKRPELLRLLEDCREGKIDLVLTKSISRFSRNTTDCLEMVRALSSYGVGIFFERENINTLTMEDEFILTVLGSLAENESISISENEKWSIQKRFEKGTFRQGMAPYGYRQEGTTLVINDDEAKVVRFIFDEAYRGIGAHKIAKELNEKGIPSMLRDRWHSGTIKQMLQNERYVGDALYQKTYADENFVRHANHGERGMYLHQNHHEAIVPREEFDRVQELIAQHRAERGIGKDTNKYQNRYVFSGKLICGECGGHLKRKIIQGRVEGPLIVWVCQTHIQDKTKCSFISIEDGAIRAAFTTVTNKLIFSQNELLVPFVQEIQGINQSDVGDEIEKINKKLEENTEKSQKMAILASDKLLDPLVFRKAQAELSAERADLNSRKVVLGVQLQQNHHGISEGGKLLKKIRGMRITEDFDEEFFTEFIKAVYVYSRTELGFEFTCGLVFREEVDR